MYLQLALLVFLCQEIFGTTSPPTITTPLGVIEGSTKRSINGRQFYSFEGVPYARPPVGKYRFMQSEPVTPWSDKWMAKTIYKCMQYNHYTPPGGDFVIGDEDCLYLNIYTPNLDTSPCLNVIVYIHGGAFMFNYGGLQRPEILLDEDVVYVNFNYRLGPLGFLSTENDIVSGNNGIKDQILALKWIKENIKYFGGNPDSITITGMSAGGASVHLHYLTSKSNGLFHRGISQSGTALNPWVLMENPLEKTKKLASILGCSTNDIKGLVKCLQKKPARQVVYAVEHFQPWLYNPFSPFGVVVDKWSSDPLLQDHPYKLLKNKQVRDLPWITSYVASEGLYPAAQFYSDEQYLKDIDSRWNELIPFILDYNYTISASKLDTVSQKIRQFYLKDKRVNKDSFMNLVKLIGDRLFLVDIEKAARLQAAATKSPVYVYYFTYRGARSKSDALSKTSKDFGTSHADDTSYVFKTYPDVYSTENDKLMSKLMTKLFVSFAENGKPELNNVKWTPLSSKVDGPFSYIKIESPTVLEMKSAKEIGNRQFWDSLPFSENERLFTVKDEL